MFSYEFYKVVHILMVVLMFSFFGIQAFGTNQKIVKMVSGIASLLLLVSGMGLIARIGIGHGEPWPVWIKVKVGIWSVLAIVTPILFKRAPHLSKVWYSFSFLLLLGVLYSVINGI